MKQTVLLFIREALGYIQKKPKTGTDSLSTSILMTPYGNFAGVRESQLEFLHMPYVDETGGVGRVPLRRLYLETILHRLAQNIGIEMNRLFDGSREFIIAADVDILGDTECAPHYYSSTKNKDNIENLKHLEASVTDSLDMGLDELPPDIKSDWISNILNPIFERVKQATLEKRGEDGLLRPPWADSQ